MPAHDPARVEETREWLDHVSLDLRAAAHNATAEPPLLEDILFHCQQAIEKALKAFLTWHDTPFRKTHDLATLSEQCIEIDKTLRPILEPAVPLTEYAWRHRYPVHLEPPTADEVSEAMQLASSITREITARLPDDVRP